jgi:hypothetical protein
VSSTPVIVPQHTELILAVAGNDNGLISRTGACQLQEHTPTTGRVSLTPIAVGDNEATITAPAMLHLYLPTLLFRRLSDDFSLTGMPAHSIRYAGLRDEIISQVGRSIVSEMTNESAAGRMFVETASLMLAARLLRTYAAAALAIPSYRPRIALTTPGYVAFSIIFQCIWPTRSLLQNWPESRDSARSILRECSLSPWAFRPTAMSADCAWSRRWQT